MSHAIEWSTSITVRQIIRYSLHQGLFLTFCIMMSFLKLQECELTKGKLQFACVPSLFLGSIRRDSWKLSEMLVSMKSMKMRRWTLRSGLNM